MNFLSRVSFTFNFEMRKFLLFLFSLLIAFVVLNVFYLIILSKIDWDFSKTKKIHSFKDEKFKVVVLGNSTALDGIDAELISTRFGATYNFAIGGASLETNFIQLVKYLKSNRPPSKVLVGLSSCHNNYNNIMEVNPIVDYYYDSLLLPVTIKDVPLFKFRWLFIENIKKLLSRDHRNAIVVDGQLRISKSVTDKSFYSLGAVQCLQEDDYLKPGYKYLHQIAEVCIQNGIQLIVFEMPCWKKSQNECEDVYVSENIEKGFKIFNFNHKVLAGSMYEVKSDWLSENHLNTSGSKKLTSLIIKKLFADSVLDHVKPALLPIYEPNK